MPQVPKRLGVQLNCIEDGTAIVIRVGVDPMIPHVGGLANVLSADEKARAEGYQDPLLRSRFVVRRAFMRMILGECMQHPPSLLRFTYGDFGKPELEASEENRGLRFNISCSDGVAAYAVALDNDVGVDIERIRSNFDYQSIVERFFSADEVRQLRKLPSGCQLQAFFDGWTRKESFLKAKGVGLSMPLNGFSVDLAAGQQASKFEISSPIANTQGWMGFNLDWSAQFAGALTVAGYCARVEFSTV